MRESKKSSQLVDCSRPQKTNPENDYSIKDSTHSLILEVPVLDAEDKDFELLVPSCSMYFQDRKACTLLAENKILRQLG